MSLPERVRQALRLGRPLAAEGPARQSAWRAWVQIRPVLDGPSFDETREGWTRRQEGRPHTSAPVRYVLRRVELSPWHLQPEWADDLDVAMAERQAPDETRVVDSEAGVAAALAEWGVDPGTLRPPAAVEYPDPPPSLGAPGPTAG